jgi:hypothetical protein
MSETEQNDAPAKPVLVSPEADQRVVQLLYDALEEAKAGKIQSVALACLANGGQYRTNWVGGAWFTTMIGIVADMLWQMQASNAQTRHRPTGPGAG